MLKFLRILKTFYFKLFFLKKSYTNKVIQNKKYIFIKKIKINYLNNKKKILFLRNFFIFLKTKYSKNRNFCKSIVLFSLILNLLIIVLLHYKYYNIYINIGHFYFIIYLFLIFYSFFFFLKKNFCIKI